MGAHYAIAPWKFWKFWDFDNTPEEHGELFIPIDLLGEETPPPPILVSDFVPPDIKPGPGTGPDGGTLRDAGPDAEVRDAGSPPKPKPEAGAPPVTKSDAGADGGATDGLDAGADATAADAGTPGVRTPGGLASKAQGGVVKVDLLLDVDVVRAHPIGKKLGPLFSAIPQWRDFLRGAETNIDPIRDTSWIHIYGPSFIHTGDDAVQVRYTASDATVDRAIELMSARVADGGAFDVGVPGVRAFLGHADNAERVILRVRSHELVIVPPKNAAEFARVLSEAAKQGKNIVPARAPGQALLFVIKDPSKQHAVKGLAIPDTLKELRIRVMPNNQDGSADVFGEGLCDTPEAAQDVAETLSFYAAAARIGYDFAPALRFSSDGNRVVFQGHSDRASLEKLVQLAARQLGVTIPAD